MTAFLAGVVCGLLIAPIVGFVRAWRLIPRGDRLADTAERRQMTIRSEGP